MQLLGSYAFLFSLLALIIIVAVAGLWLVRRYISCETLAANHDVAGHFLTIIGTLYAIILGLVVVGSLNDFQKARLTVDQESNALKAIFNLSQGLPQPVALNLQQDCLRYAETLVTDEWQTMENSKFSPTAARIVKDLWTKLVQFEPTTSKQADLHASILSKLDDLEDSRGARLTTAQPEYESIIWFVLIVGGVVVIVSTYFFGIEKFAIQSLMTALLTLVLGLNLMIIAMFGNPYSGDVRVSSALFERDIKYFQNILHK